MRETYTYDADGNRLSELIEEDPDGDGTPDSITRFTYTYDADGNRLSRVFEDDPDGDGSFDPLWLLDEAHRIQSRAPLTPTTPMESRYPSYMKEIRMRTARRIQTPFAPTPTTSMATCYRM